MMFSILGEYLGIYPHQLFKNDKMLQHLHGIKYCIQSVMNEGKKCHRQFRKRTFLLGYFKLIPYTFLVFDEHDTISFIVFKIPSL